MVNLLQHAFFAHLRDKISGRNHKITTSALRFELSIHAFIGFVGRVDNLDSGFFSKVF